MKKKVRRLVGSVDKVYKLLERYDDLSFLERYAIFMAQVQTIELLLKRLLSKKAHISFDEVDQYTALGAKFIRKLEEEGMQDAILEHLARLKEHRDYFAHEFLANLTLIGSILKEDTEDCSKSSRQLFHALFTAEQFLLLRQELPAKAFWKKTLK